MGATRVVAAASLVFLGAFQAAAAGLIIGGLNLKPSHDLTTLSFAAPMAPTVIGHPTRR